VLWCGVRIVSWRVQPRLTRLCRNAGHPHVNEALTKTTAVSYTQSKTSMAKRLEGQVALVTGAASGNGRAIAFCLAAEGAKVLCVDMQEQSRTTGTEGSDTTHGQIVKQGGEAAFEKADVTKSEDVQSVIKAAVSKWGRLDIIVNK
jgi:hypothetical protein